MLLHERQGYCILRAPVPKTKVSFWGKSLGEAQEFEDNHGRFLRYFNDEHVVQEICAEISDSLRRHDLLGRREVTRASLIALHTVPTAQQQEMHVDFPARLLGLGIEEIPLAVLWPLNSPAVLWTPSGRLHIPCGQMLVFRGDFVHAGAAGTEQPSGWRLHCNIQCKKHMTKTNNYTYALA